jgi:hypothetical protein
MLSFAHSMLVMLAVIYVSSHFLVGYAVTQLVEVLRYKPESRGIDSRWCYWNFSLACSFWLPYGPGGESASNRN